MSHLLVLLQEVGFPDLTMVLLEEKERQTHLRLNNIKSVR